MSYIRLLNQYSGIVLWAEPKSLTCAEKLGCIVANDIVVEDVGRVPRLAYGVSGGVVIAFQNVAMVTGREGLYKYSKILS